MVVESSRNILYRYASLLILIASFISGHALGSDGNEQTFDIEEYKSVISRYYGVFSEHSYFGRARKDFKFLKSIARDSKSNYSVSPFRALPSDLIETAVACFFAEALHRTPKDIVSDSLKLQDYLMAYQSAPFKQGFSVESFIREQPDISQATQAIDAATEICAGKAEQVVKAREQRELLQKQAIAEKEQRQRQAAELRSAEKSKRELEQALIERENAKLKQAKEAGFSSYDEYQTHIEKTKREERELAIALAKKEELDRLRAEAAEREEAEHQAALEKARLEARMLFEEGQKRTRDKEDAMPKATSKPPQQSTEVQQQRSSNISFQEIRRNMETMTDIQFEEYAKILKGKRVQWRGYVEEVKEKFFGGYEVLVDMDHPNEPLSVQDVSFDVPKEQAMALRKDSPVQFEGTISSALSILTSLQVSLDDARLIR